MKTVYAFYAADRYWPDREKLEKAYKDLTARLNPGDPYLLTDSVELEVDGDVLVVVPSPQLSLLFDATSFIAFAPIASNGSLRTIDFATVTPSFVLCI